MKDIKSGMKINNNNFITEANTIHSNKYDYSKVKFINNQTKVCIICPEHGEFWQDPYHHINRKQGCPLCGLKKIWDVRGRKKDEDIIKNAQQIHGDKYDYSKMEYVNDNTKIIIICPEHGEFKQTPRHHILRKQGCPLCKNKKLSENLKSKYTTKQFIEKAKKVHGDYFDYSKCEYKGQHVPICIIDPINGEFW